LNKTQGITFLQVLAIAAIVVVAGFILFPLFAQGGPPPGTNWCVSSQKQLAISLLIYAADHNEHMPNRDVWMDEARMYSKSDGVFHCPSVRGRDETRSNLYGFAFHSRLSEADISKVDHPEEVPLHYDSVNLARNASDPFTSLPNPPRKHKNRDANVVAYLSGHVKVVRPNEAP